MSISFSFAYVKVFQAPNDAPRSAGKTSMSPHKIPKRSCTSGPTTTRVKMFSSVSSSPPKPATTLSTSENEENEKPAKIPKKEIQRITLDSEVIDRNLLAKVQRGCKKCNQSMMPKNSARGVRVQKLEEHVWAHVGKELKRPLFSCASCSMSYLTDSGTIYHCRNKHGIHNAKEKFDFFDDRPKYQYDLEDMWTKCFPNLIQAKTVQGIIYLEKFHYGGLAVSACLKRSWAFTIDRKSFYDHFQI